MAITQTFVKLPDGWQKRITDATEYGYTSGERKWRLRLTDAERGTVLQTTARQVEARTRTLTRAAYSMGGGGVVRVNTPGATQPTAVKLDGLALVACAPDAPDAIPVEQLGATILDWQCKWAETAAFYAAGSYGN